MADVVELLNKKNVTGGQSKRICDAEIVIMTQYPIRSWLQHVRACIRGRLIVPFATDILCSLYGELCVICPFCDAWPPTIHKARHEQLNLSPLAPPWI